MKARVGPTQYADFLSSTLSDPLNAVLAGTLYFFKSLMISCHELLYAWLVVSVIRCSVSVGHKNAQFLAYYYMSLSVN